MTEKKAKKQLIKKIVLRKYIKTNYPIGDFLIRLKNLINSNKKEICIGKTNLIKQVALSLKHLGYLNEVKEEDNNLTVSISYKKKEPVLSDIKVVSKPGLRIYLGTDELEKYRSPKILLLSTSKGILSNKEAVKKGVGGEVLAEIL